MMWKQIKLLFRVQIANAFGWNEAKYSSDPKKKRNKKFLGLAFIFIGLMVIFYDFVLSSVYCSVGMSEIVPPYLFAVTSLVILFFTMFKAGSVIFDMQSYEKVIVLPVSSSAIVISRFLVMYVFDIALSVLILIPGAAVYALNVAPSAIFYIMMIISPFVLPLLPMTIATIIGTLIQGISSRMKYKNIVSVAFSLAATVGIVVASTAFSAKSPSISGMEFTQISESIISSFKKAYPPTILYADAITENNILKFLLFILISIVIFALFVIVTKKVFVSVCTSLQSNTAKRDYVMTAQTQSSPLKALYKKELKRYTSSSLYVLNTVIGYVLLVVLSIAIAVTGEAKVNEMLQLDGLLDKILPYLMGVLCAMSPSTTSAISIEGKQWWIVKSLPVSVKNVFDSKLLVNLTVAVPCYLISEVLLCVSLHTDVYAYLRMIIIPLVYMIFSAVLGLTVNIHMPLMNWESENAVVKQSGAVLVSMLLSFVVCGVPVILVFAVKGNTENIIAAVTSVVLLALTAVMYTKNNKIELKTIG